MTNRASKTLGSLGALSILLVPACDEAAPPSAEVAATTAAFEGKLKLTCTGETTFLYGGVEPFEEVIYVDRAAGKYCSNACQVAEDIHSQTQSVVVFRDVPSDGYRLVNRATWHPMTGSYRAKFAATYRAYLETETKAACVAVPYEGSIPIPLEPPA